MKARNVVKIFNQFYFENFFLKPARPPPVTRIRSRPSRKCSGTFHRRLFCSNQQNNTVSVIRARTSAVTGNGLEVRLEKKKKNTLVDKNQWAFTDENFNFLETFIDGVLGRLRLSISPPFSSTESHLQAQRRERPHYAVSTFGQRDRHAPPEPRYGHKQHVVPDSQPVRHVILRYVRPLAAVFRPQRQVQLVPLVHHVQFAPAGMRAQRANAHHQLHKTRHRRAPGKLRPTQCLDVGPGDSEKKKTSR